MKCVAYMVIFLLLGCVPVAIKPDADFASALPEQRSADALATWQTQQRLQSLLVLGRRALEAGRLMRPAEDSAYKWFMQVLDIDDLNDQAHWGMRQITAQYMELAEQAFRDQRRGDAELMMARAMTVSATPQQCQALRVRYPDQKPRDNEFILSPADLAARNAGMIKHLGTIARQARDKHSRLTIVARSDSEGRWVYKQMRNAVDGYRLRGNIAIGSRPKVVLIDLSSG